MPGVDVAVREDRVVGDFAADPVGELGGLALGRRTVLGRDVLERFPHAPGELLVEERLDLVALDAEEPIEAEVEVGQV